MTSPKPHSSADAGVLGQALKESCARIISRCAEAFAHETRERANQSVLETIQKNLPLLLDELGALLPQVMTEEAKMPPMPDGGIECRAGYRLDLVIQALGGIREVVVLELLQLKGCVTDAVLDSACREARLFFDFKVAGYCLQFVEAQDAEVALRTRQLKAASERLGNASEISKASSHSRLELLQGVTHELRNSLQSVLLYARAVVDGPRDPGVEEIMERLAMNGMHLQKLLDRLQDYSPLLAGEWHVRLDAVDAGAFLSQLEQRHRAMAGATKTQLKCRQTCGTTAIITDQNALNFIAGNLVSNAIRSAKSGRVEVGISADGPGRILLTVADDGHGIGLVEARQMFRVLHHDSEANFPGLKLGLLASRYLTHLLGGEMTFESEVGKGASFRVALPQLSSHP